MPTALELTQKDLELYIKASKRQQTSPSLTPVQQQERDHLLNRIRKAAGLLKKRFGAKQVILFGSLAHDLWFAPDSDVDIAVKGLSGDYWKAWRLVEEIIEDRCVDLVEMETAREPLVRAIRRQGVEL